MRIANTGSQLVNILLAPTGGPQQFRRLGQVPNDGYWYQFLGADETAVTSALTGPLAPFVAAGTLKTTRLGQTEPDATDPLTGRVLTLPELGPGDHADPYAPDPEPQPQPEPTP